MLQCYVCERSEDMCNSRLKESDIIFQAAIPLCAECNLELVRRIVETPEALLYFTLTEQVWFLRENHDGRKTEDHLDLIKDIYHMYIDARKKHLASVLRIIGQVRTLRNH